MTLMRSVATACLLAVLAGSAPATAHATANPPLAGRPCEFDSVAPVGSTTYTGTIFGGPVVAPETVVSMRCSIHVGNTTHSGAAVVSESSLPLHDVTALEPRAISFVADVTDIVVICTEATVDGTTWYLSRDGWTTNVGASCDLPSDFGDVVGLLPPPLAQIVGGVWCLLFSAVVCDVVGPLLYEVDDAVCPTLVALAPGVPGVVDIRPDGDLYVGGEFWWDCPPYEPV